MADALAAMNRKMAEQDVKIEEYMNEIRNLRQRLQLQGGEGNGGNEGNPTDNETYGNQTHSESVRVERYEHNEDRPLTRLGILREPLYARFGKLKPSEFAGSIDPLEAEEWISSM